VHNGPAALSPLELSLGTHLPQKVLIVGHCNAESWGFHQQNVTKTSVEFILVNNLQSLPPKSNEELAQIDCQVIQFPLRFILNDHYIWGGARKSEQELEEVFQRSVSAMRTLFDLYTQYNEQNNLLTFVVNFMAPSFNPLGKLMPIYSLTNPQHYIERLNQELEKMALHRQNAFCLNVNSMTSFFGKRYIQEDVLHLVSHGSFMPGYNKDESRIEHAPRIHEHYNLAVTDFRNMLWIEIISAFRIANPVQAVKLIIVDLDDTLWTGSVGDMTQLDISVTEGWPVGLLESLSYFKDRGGLIAIVSKNDPQVVKNAWDQFYESRFSLSNFVSVKCSFGRKSDMIQEILKETNLTSKSALFIDDNPIERAEVKVIMPDIRVLHGYHYYWRKVVLLSSETQTARLSEESLKKTELIQAQMERQQDMTKSISRDAFLKEMGIKVNIQSLNKENSTAMTRCFELLNKTNQFNTTGKRWTQSEFQALVNNDTIYYFSVQDRYSSHGIVGVILLQRTRILQFVMSCRVIGLTVEWGVMSKLLQKLQTQYPQMPIEAQWLATESNHLAKDLFSGCGFEDKNGVCVYDPSTIDLVRFIGEYNFT